MRPLSGLDASFVHVESPTAHMHTLKVLELELSDRCEEAPLPSVRRELEAWLTALPPLRFELVHAPLGLGRPMWREVAAVDVDRHIEHLRIAGRDRRRALERALAALISHPLPRDRPMWRVLVVEGVHQGRGPARAVIALQIHHALADGMAASALLRRVTSTWPPGPRPPSRAVLAEEPMPSGARLLGAALAERTRALEHVPSAIVRTMGVAARQAVRGRALPGAEAHLFQGPRVSFGGPVTPRRDIALLGLSFDLLRRAKESAGCRLNDVVLATVAGALRRYLAERNEPIHRPLVAAMPIEATNGEEHSWGNRVSTLLVPVHVEVAHPRRRLEATIESSATARVLHGLLGPDFLQHWSEISPPDVWRWLWRGTRWLPRPMVHVIVSNVPGPSEERWVGGARLADLHSVGPLLETTGLNVTFWSYAGRMNGCVLGCPDQGTDVRAIAEYLGDAAAELTEALEMPRAAE